MSGKGLLGLVIAWLASWPLQACPVCFSAKEGSRDAFLWTTILLSLVPLAMMGAVFFAIRYIVRQKSKQEILGR